MNETITFSPYKCFREGITIEVPELVNLIIGKNNSGKSSFLDYIATFYTRKNTKINNFSFDYSFQIKETILEYFNASIDFRYYYNGQRFDKKYLIGKNIVIHADNLSGTLLKYSFIKEKSDNLGYTPFQIDINNINLLFDKQVDKYKTFFKLGAERDIKPEPHGNLSDVRSNGDGLVANLFYHKTHKNGDRRIINAILQDINEVLKGEYSFKDLNVFENSEGTHEINLTNPSGEEIPLSEMGSGIKTIIFVSFVLNNRLIKKEDSVLFFEEIENNLHPEVQRRLFNKIYEYAIKNKCRVFITTHSNVAINTFFGKESAMVYHIYKKDEITSNVRTISTAINKREILDDLGVKANDIFQTNGIIWVEGPSDRIYLNKWINLIDPKLKENVDYTFLYYGGKLLAHYTADNLEEQGLIDILLTNRNSAIVMDSDIKEIGKDINQTKKRIFDEFEKNGSFCWVTRGREIENYISQDAINRAYPDSNKEQINIYEDCKDYIKDLEPDFEATKVEFAKKLIFKETDLNILDLKEQITNLVNVIKQWNS